VEADEQQIPAAELQRMIRSKDLILKPRLKSWDAAEIIMRV
jgi:hypothetical protein